jgi:hypothetical protein
MNDFIIFLNVFVLQGSTLFALQLIMLTQAVSESAGFFNSFCRGRSFLVFLVRLQI